MFGTLEQDIAQGTRHRIVQTNERIKYSKQYLHFPCLTVQRRTQLPVLLRLPGSSQRNTWYPPELSEIL